VLGRDLFRQARYTIGTNANAPSKANAPSTRGDATSLKEVSVPNCRPALQKTKLAGMMPSAVAAT
jgi:hypothetical protein